MQVGCGEEHLVVLDTRGNVWTAGDATHHALGFGDCEKDEESPVQLTCLDNITHIAVGQTCSVALEKSGAMYTWGTLSELDPIPLPEKMKQNLQNEKIVYIAAGRQHCAAITEEGLLYTWGENGHVSIQSDAGAM